MTTTHAARASAKGAAAHSIHASDPETCSRSHHGHLAESTPGQPSSNSRPWRENLPAHVATQVAAAAGMPSAFGPTYY